jgi:hypothetical protein
MIKGIDTSFELRKFSVVSVTGERREQLGLAGVQVGEVIAIIEEAPDGEEPLGKSWKVLSLPEPDAKGVLGVTADPV